MGVVRGRFGVEGLVFEAWEGKEIGNLQMAKGNLQTKKPMGSMK